MLLPINLGCERLLHEGRGKNFKVHLNGYDITDALADKSASPRREFFFLATFKDYPPSQKTGSFSIDAAMEALQRAGNNWPSPGSRTQRQKFTGPTA